MAKTSGGVRGVGKSNAKSLERYLTSKKADVVGVKGNAFVLKLGNSEKHIVVNFKTGRKSKIYNDGFDAYSSSMLKHQKGNPSVFPSKKYMQNNSSHKWESIYREVKNKSIYFD